MDAVNPTLPTPTAAATAALGSSATATAAPGSSAAAIAAPAVRDMTTGATMGAHTDTTAKLPDAEPATRTASKVMPIDVTVATPDSMSDDVIDATTETRRNTIANLPDVAAATGFASTGMAIDISDATLATICTTSMAMSIDAIDAATETYPIAKLPNAPATTSASVSILIDGTTETCTNTIAKLLDAAPATAFASASMLGGMAASTDPDKTFDVTHANALVGDEDWIGLESYLKKFLVDVSGEKVEDVIMMHSGLLLISCQEQLLKMLTLKKYEEAQAFFESFIRPLKEAKGEYHQLDLDLRIAELDMLLKKVNKRSKLAKPGGRVAIAITDYIFLYFPNAICRTEEGKDGQSLWQFVMKINFPPADDQKPKRSFRYLACQWECPPSQYGMATIGYHLSHEQDKKICPRVTQNILDRLSALMNRVIPDILALAERLNSKKWKVSFLSIPGQKGSSQQSDKTRSMPSSPSINTSIRVVPSLGLDPKSVSEKAHAVQKIAKALVDELEGLPVPASHRKFVVHKALELHDVAHGLVREAFNVTSSSAPEAQRSPADAEDKPVGEQGAHPTAPDVANQ